MSCCGAAVEYRDGSMKNPAVTAVKAQAQLVSCKKILSSSFADAEPKWRRVLVMCEGVTNAFD